VAQAYHDEASPPRFSLRENFSRQDAKKMQRKELIFILSSALLDDRLNFRLTLNSHTMLLRVAVSAVSRDDVNYPAERARRTNP
jgi:hypothetical protein